MTIYISLRTHWQTIYIETTNNKIIEFVNKKGFVPSQLSGLFYKYFSQGKYSESMVRAEVVSLREGIKQKLNLKDKSIKVIEV